MRAIKEKKIAKMLKVTIKHVEEIQPIIESFGTNTLKVRVSA